MSEHGARVLMERKEKKQNKRLMIQQFSTAYPHGLLEVLQRNSGEEEGVCGADALERRAGPPGEKATLDNDSRWWWPWPPGQGQPAAGPGDSRSRV